MMHCLVNKIVNKNIKSNLKYFKHHLNGCITILDVGCGSGQTAKILKNLNQNFNVFALDIENHLWRENQDIPFKTYNGRHIPFKDKSFDAILLFFVLHHADCPENIIRESYRVAKKRVIIFEEVYKNFLQRIIMIAYDILVNSLIFGSPISLPKFRKVDEWIELFSRVGIRVNKIIKLKKIWIYPPQRILFIIDKNE